MDWCGSNGGIIKRGQRWRIGASLTWKRNCSSYTGFAAMRKRAKITQLVMKERNVFPQKPNQTKPKTRQTETRQKVEAGYTCGTQRAKTDPHRHSQAGRQLPLGISAQKVRARGFCQGLGNLDGPYREWTNSCTWRSGSDSLLRTLLSIFFFLPFSLSFTLEHCCFCS